jgi:hypothetical protein
MKQLVYLTVAVSALVSPALSFAQASVAPVTRAEVRADLVRLEQAGYDPSTGEDVNYPADVQVAEAKVAAQQQGAAATAQVTGASDSPDVGAAMSGTTASGAGKTMPAQPVGKSCTGPVSFCNVFAGG